MSYQHPRISVEQACQAYSLSFSELNYDNGLLSGWVSREDLTYPLVHFINPATKTKVGAVDRWTFRLLIVEQILEINQSQGVINSTHDTMDFVSDAIQQELNRNEMTEVTNWVAREVQQFADANVTGWLVDVTFEGAGQCIGLDVAKVATPVFTPSRGIFGGFGEFTLTCATTDADIYYTLDGSPVTPQTGTLYTGAPVVFNQTTQPKAKAFKAGLIDSDTATAQYQVDLLALSFSQAGGIFPIDSPPQIVPIINSIDADVFFTTDGSTPTQSSTPFTTPFVPTQNVTLTGRGFLDPALPSNVVQQAYQLKLNAPTVNAGGTFISERLVQADPAVVGVNEYRVNGGAWVVGDSVLVQVSSVVDWRAVSPNYVTSDVVSVNVTIKCATPTISPNGGFFDVTQNVTLTTNEAGGTTRFTTNGTEPTVSSPIYTAPFAITADTVVLAKTFRAGCSPSDTASATFTLIQPIILLGDADSAAGSRLWRSLNNAATWQELQPFGNVDAVYKNSQLSNNAQTILVVATIGAADVMAVTQDGGVTWQTSTFPAALVTVNNISMSSDGVNILACADVGGGLRVFRSTNGGLNFTACSPVNNAFNTVALSPNAQTGYAFRAITTPSTACIYRTTNMGDTWDVIFTSTNFNAFSAVCSNQHLYFQNILSGSSNGIRIAHNATSQTTIAVSSTVSVIGVSQNGELLVSASFSGANQIRVSTNQGATSGFVSIPFTAGVRAVRLSPTGLRCIIGATGSNVCRSVNTGVSFTALASTPSSGARIWQVANNN